MKRRIKFLLSAAMGTWDRLRSRAARLARRPLQGRCIVLYYHAVPAEHRDRFARQLDMLLQVSKPIPAGFAGPLQPDSLYSVVTFDDAFASVLENAMPELDRRGIPWTVFVPSACLGQSPTWLRNADPRVRRERVVTVDELQALARNPLVTIASHSATHADLPRLPLEDAATELQSSKSSLESILGRPVDLFSFPYGAHTGALHERARRLGYRRLFTSDPVPAFSIPDEFVSGRIGVEPNDGRLEFRLKVSGAYRWSGRRRAPAVPSP